MKKNTKTLSRTLLLSIAAVAVSVNLHCNESRSGADSYSSTSAYIRVTVTASEQATQDAINKSYALMGKSDRVFRRSINDDITEDGNRRDRIRHTSLFTGELDTTLAKLRKNLQVRAIPGTNLIRISLTHAKGIERAEIINAVAETIVSETADQQRVGIAAHMKSINTRLEEILGTVAARQKAIAMLRGESEVPLMRARSTITQEAVATLIRSFTLLRLQKAQAQADYVTLQEQKKNGTLAASHEIQAEVAKDPDVLELKSAILKLEIAALGEKDSKQSIMILERLKAMLVSKQKAATNRAIQHKLEKLETEVTSVSERLLSVGNQFQEESSRLRDLGVALNKIAELESEINRLEKQADELNTKILNLRISMYDSPLTLQSYAEMY